jgi:hypothetical protein
MTSDVKKLDVFPDRLRADPQLQREVGHRLNALLHPFHDLGFELRCETSTCLLLIAQRFLP